MLAARYHGACRCPERFRSPGPRAAGVFEGRARPCRQFGSSFQKKVVVRLFLGDVCCPCRTEFRSTSSCSANTARTASPHRRVASKSFGTPGVVEEIREENLAYLQLVDWAPSYVQTAFVVLTPPDDHPDRNRRRFATRMSREPSQGLYEEFILAAELSGWEARRSLIHASVPLMKRPRLHRTKSAKRRGRR